jgi:SAM-dependent methyltransferase
LNQACDICGNARDNRMHQAREMMFGQREVFSYLECSSCGCLQNRSVPADLGRYYGTNYYSVARQLPRRRPLYDLLKAVRTKAWLAAGKSRPGFIGSLLLRAFGAPGLLEWAQRAGMRQDSSMLEIGCGTGEMLLTMRSEGFTRLTGADPFIEQDIDHGGGLKILKLRVAELQGRYDYIVLEHSFEHIPEQRATLAALRALLAPGGRLILSLPLCNEAWQRYGVDWIQLDAPRHLYLHTEKSLRLLAQEPAVGLRVDEVVYDSGAGQFWGSEQYRQDVPLLDPRSAHVNPATTLFTQQQMQAWAAEAEQLNAAGLGDQATFYLSAT